MNFCSVSTRESSVAVRDRFSPATRPLASLLALAAFLAPATRSFGQDATAAMDGATLGLNSPGSGEIVCAPDQPTPATSTPLYIDDPMIGAGASSCSLFEGTVDGYFGIYMPPLEPLLPVLPSTADPVMCGLVYSSGMNASACKVTMPVSVNCTNLNQYWAGSNCFLTSRPQLSVNETASDGANRAFLWFDGQHRLTFKELMNGATHSGIFVGVNGTTGTLERASVALSGQSSGYAQSLEIYKYHDRRGRVYWFFGKNPTDPVRLDSQDLTLYLVGQLWKVTYEDGESTPPSNYAGSTVNDLGIYNGLRGFEICTDGSAHKLTPRLVRMFDAAGRQYDYSYGTFGSNASVTSVTLTANSSVQSSAAMTYDSSGRLRLVQTSTRTSDSSVYTYRYQYFLYDGSSDRMTMTLQPEGVRRRWLDSGKTITYTDKAAMLTFLDGLASTLSNLTPYAASFVTYDGSGRVATLVSNGQCGCSGGGSSGEFRFSYESGPSDIVDSDASYDCGTTSGVGGTTTTAPWWKATTHGAGTRPRWARRTSVVNPDGDGSYGSTHSRTVTYYDDTAQVLATVRAATTLPTSGSPDTSSQTYLAQVYERDAKARINVVYSPETVKAYDHAGALTGDVFDMELVDDNSTPTSTTPTGTITRYEYADDNGYPYLTGHVVSRVLINDEHNLGWYVVSQSTFADNSAYSGKWNLDLTASSKTARLGKPLVTASRVYKTPTASTGSGTVAVNYDLTEYAYVFWATGSPWALKQVTTTLPKVTSSENGDDSTPTTDVYVDQDTGRTVFAKNVAGRLDYYGYATGSGLLQTSISDAGTTSNARNGNLSADATTFGITLSSAGLHNITSYFYDDLARSSTTTIPSSDRVLYTAYSRNGEYEGMTLSGPSLAGSTYYGPVSATIQNLAGRTTAKLTLTLTGTSNSTTTAITSWNDSSKVDLFELFKNSISGHAAEIARISRSTYDPTGNRLASSKLATAWSTGSGAAITAEDTTVYAYDGFGRSVAIAAPTGTVRRTTFDKFGRAIEQAIGTNDYGATSAISTSGSSNLTTIAKTTYSTRTPTSGSYAIGQSRVASTAQDADGDWTTTTSDTRATSFSYDYRGRAVFVDSPLAPFQVSAYDFRGRTVASAIYGDRAGLGISTDPVNDATANGGANKRLGLTETKYDGRGRVWQSRNWQIDQSSGAKVVLSSVDQVVDTLSWFDPEGHVLKASGPSGLMKYSYDRLDRRTISYALAKTDDTSYANASGVSGDIVLEQRHSTYGATSGLTLWTMNLSRIHSDTSTTGALDSSGQPNASLARAQIAAFWYDSLDRLTVSAFFGTNVAGSGNGASFSYGSAPSASVLPDASTVGVTVTTTAYNDDGSIDYSTDGKGVKSKTKYDQAGRRIASIANYVNGTPSGSTLSDKEVAADDVVTRYKYDGGLLKYMWVDVAGNDGASGSPPSSLTGDDAKDQISEYVYGTTKGTIGDQVGASNEYKSAIATGHLLRTVIYPPQSSGQSAADRSVNFGYNALSERAWSRDQNGTILMTSYDIGGRQSTQTVVDVGSGVDGTVRRVGTSYSSRGQLESVTQYNATSSGTALNGVKYTYDDWGNIARLDQDRDSAVGGSGASALAVEWAYSRTAPAGGRPRVQRDSMTLPGPNASSSSPYSGEQRRVKYGYGSSGSIEDSYGRVDSMKLAAVRSGGADGQIGGNRAEYSYLGADLLVGVNLPEPGRFSNQFNASNVYDGLDQMDRVIASRWAGSGGSVYSVTLTYDENGNITRILDPIELSAGVRSFDTVYSLDELNRVTNADRGTWSGSTITGGLRNTEAWVLTQTGDWRTDTIDTDGTGSPEFSDTRTFSGNANEISSRTSPYGVSFNYDKSGELIDTDKYGVAGGAGRKFVYDAFGRMVKVTKSDDTVLAEYVYDGLGQRIGWHYDVNRSGGSPNTSDAWYWFLYDDRWRIVETYFVSGGGSGTDYAASFRSGSTDSNGPKERFVFHASGRDGLGRSSYIDSMAIMDRDLSTSWGAVSDGVCETRHYLLANWRSDTIEIESVSGARLAAYRYTAYGKRQSLLTADYNQDGMQDFFDQDDFVACYEDGEPSGCNADWNKDGFVDFYDYDAFIESFTADVDFGSTGAGGGVRHLYAGYELDPLLDLAHVGGTDSVYLVRNRVFTTELGVWTRRDPLGYVEGADLYWYASDNPEANADAMGLASCSSGMIDPAAHTKEECQKKLARLEVDKSTSKCGKRFDAIRDRIADSKKCSKNACPNRSISISCCDNADENSGCKYKGGDGKEHRPQGTQWSCGVCICYENFPRDWADMCEILTHEMTHAFDHNCLGLDYGDCDDRACTEIRAYSADGNCHSECNRFAQKGDKSKFRECLKECIIKSANRSVEGKGCPAGVVEKNIDRCMLGDPDKWDVEPGPKPTPLPPVQPGTPSGG